MIDKEIIKRNFSRCAAYYDRFSVVQNICARRLISKIHNGGISDILDIGCGTGNFTKLLRERFPASNIKAIDISWDMVEVARRKLKDADIEFIVADAETMEFKKTFDLICSNASFQWFQDLENTLSRYTRMLGKNGVILFSVFGPRSFNELNSSLEELFAAPIAVSAYDFLEGSKIEAILRKHFKEISIEEELFEQRYCSLSELLRAIRYTGVRGRGLNRHIWTLKTVRALEDIYRKRFSIPGVTGQKYITTTYQIYFCKGINEK
jgi:malonyl-CoA O-methyltransferase